MRIEVQMLPPISSSPNWRGHWAKRYRDAQVYKSAVFYAAVNIRNRLESWQPGFPPFEKPKLTLTFFFPSRRIRDEDNLRARFKPGLDALVAAGIIESDSIDSLKVEPIRVAVDKRQAPLTRIEIEELKDEK